MSVFLEVSETMMAVKCPPETTWAKVTKAGKGLDGVVKTMDLESDLFLQYGREGATYYSPETFYLPEGKWTVDKIENGFIVLCK